LIYFFSFIIFLTLGTGVILEYFFPTEEVRVLAAIKELLLKMRN
jgi:hypothetical protein